MGSHSKILLEWDENQRQFPALNPTLILVYNPNVVCSPLSYFSSLGLFLRLLPWEVPRLCGLHYVCTIENLTKPVHAFCQIAGGVYLSSFVDCWQARPASSCTSHAIYPGHVSLSCTFAKSSSDKYISCIQTGSNCVYWVRGELIILWTVFIGQNNFQWLWCHWKIMN